jgi:hypothetical protein
VPGAASALIGWQIAALAKDVGLGGTSPGRIVTSLLLEHLVYGGDEGTSLVFTP